MAYTQIQFQRGFDSDGAISVTGFEDEKTGDIYEAIDDPYDDEASIPGKLVATGAALKNPDIQNFLDRYNIYNRYGTENVADKYADVSVAQQFYDLKQSNPNAYYNQLSADLGSQIAENIASNKGEHNVNFNKQLNQIKQVNPAAYYSAELGVLGDSIGWQIGQNRSERNEPTLKKIESLVPDAIAAGLTIEQINSIVGNNANVANVQNQTRIANEAASPGGFNFQKDLLPGLAIFGGAVGGAALGGAFSAVPAAGSSVGGLTAAAVPSLTGGLEIAGGSALAGTGAGAAAVPAGGALSSLGSLAFVPPAIGGSAGFLAPTLGANVASSGLGLSASNVPSLASGLEVGTSGALTNLNPSSNFLSQAGDVLKGTQLAKGLLGGTQQPQAQAPVQAPKSIMPRGQVDYSGILNLLQTRSQQRNPYSLLG